MNISYNGNAGIACRSYKITKKNDRLCSQKCLEYFAFYKDYGIDF